jgi:hypothetical protein
MFKTTIANKVISFAVLLALLLASFPTASVAAKDDTRGLQAKWSKLLETYNRQAIIHNSVPRQVAHWMSDFRRAPKSKKAEIEKDLAISNTAWVPVASIVMKHTGFDAQGKVIDKAAAQQSIKDLSKALQRYKTSIKNLKALMRLYGIEAYI